MKSVAKEVGGGGRKQINPPPLVPSDRAACFCIISHLGKIICCELRASFEKP